MTVLEAPNAPGELEVPEELIVVAGQEGQAQIIATDPDDEDLELRAEGLPVDATFADLGNGLGALTFAPEDDAAAAETTVTVVASDGRASAQAEVVLRVIPAEDPGDDSPTVALPELITVAEGDWLVLDGSDSVAADGGELSHRREFAGATYDGAVVRLPALDDLLAAATLTVTDANGREARAEATVQIVNVPPLVRLARTLFGGEVADIDLTSAPVGEPVDLTIDLTDPSVLDAHTATEHDRPASRRHVLLDHRYEASGDYTLTVEVCDADGGCGEVAATIAVRVPAEPDLSEHDDPDPTQPLAAGPVDPGDEPASPGHQVDDTQDPAEVTDPSPTPSVPGAAREARNDMGPERAPPLARTGASVGALGFFGLLALLFGSALVRGPARRRRRIGIPAD